MPVYHLVNDLRKPAIEPLWMWANQLDHNRIIQALQTRGVTTLTQYQVYPFTKSETEGWLLRHQQLHNEMNAALGLDGTDLQTIDFSQSDEFQRWIEDHWREHQAAMKALGLT